MNARLGLAIDKHDMTTERGELGQTVVIPHLVSFGIVATVLTILFGFIYFSILATNRETLKGSLIGEVSVDFGRHLRSPSANTDRLARPIAAQTNAPNSVDFRMLMPSAARDLTTSDMQLEGFVSYWNFGTPPDREPSLTVRELKDGLPKQAAATDKTLPVGGGEPKHEAIPTMPVVQPVSVSPSASPSPSQATRSVDEVREQLFQAFQSLHPLPPPLDQVTTTQQSRALTPGQGERSGGFSLSSKAGFQYRVRKECGPIRDPELRHQCILSFRFHNR